MIKEIARCACALCLASSLSACKGTPDQPTSPTTGVSVSATVTPTPEIETVDDVEKYYPELKDFDLKANGTIVTNRGVRVNWYNYSDLKFNEAAAQATLSYFQEAMPPEGIGTIVTLGGRPTQVVSLPRAGDQARSLFITPQDAPRPERILVSRRDYPTAATLIDRRRAVSTYIHLLDNPPNVPFFASTEAHANSRFAVEACQSFIITGIVPRRGEPTPTQRMADDSQEAMCNSLGIAFALKQQGMLFGLYDQVQLTQSGFNYQLVKLSAAGYNAIPNVGKILEKR